MPIRRTTRQPAIQTELEIAARRAELVARMAEPPSALPPDVEAAYLAAVAAGMPEIQPSGFAHEHLAAVTDAVRKWQALTQGPPCFYCGSIKPRRDDPRMAPKFTTVNGHQACGACAGTINRNDEQFLLIQSFHQRGCLRRGVPMFYQEAWGTFLPAGEVGYSGVEPWGQASREAIQRMAIENGARPRDFVGPDAPPADWFPPAPSQKSIRYGVDRIREFEEWQRGVDREKEKEAKRKKHLMDSLAIRDSMDPEDVVRLHSVQSERDVIRQRVGEKNVGRAKAALDRHGGRAVDLHPIGADGSIRFDKRRGAR